MSYKKLETAIIVLVLFVLLQIQSSTASVGTEPGNGITIVGVWQGDTIYIRSDGSVEPADAPLRRDGNVYVLTDDIFSTSRNIGIYISRNGITIDGNGHKISGSISYGIYFLSGEDIKIRNLTVEGFSTGIYSPNGRRIEITNCTFKTKGSALMLNGFRDSVIVGNVFIGTGVDGQLAVNRNNLVKGNIVNGKPLVIVENERGKVIRGIEVGQLIIINSRDILVENLVVVNTTPGIGVYNSENITVRKCRIERNGWAGVYVKDSTNVKVVENLLMDNSIGVYLHFSTNVQIIGNEIRSIKARGNGIDLYASSSNRVIGNVVEGCFRAVRFANEKSFNNTFYGNDFIDNVESVLAEVKTFNVWDDGSRGNYWSDYKGVDGNNDGIGDTPYVIGENNVDRYPLIKPVHKAEFTVVVTSAYGVVNGSGVYSKGSIATLSLDRTTIDYGNGTRRVFKGWFRDGERIGGERSLTFTVDKPVEIRAEWDTEYEVRVSSERGAVTGSGWYKAGDRVSISLTQTSFEDLFSRYTFEYFSSDGTVVSTSPTFTLTVEKPIHLVAHWRRELKIGTFILPIALAILLILIILLAILATRRKRRE